MCLFKADVRNFSVKPKGMFGEKHQSEISVKHLESLSLSVIAFHFSQISSYISMDVELLVL